MGRSISLGGVASYGFQQGLVAWSNAGRETLVDTPKVKEVEPVTGKSQVVVHKSEGGRD